MNEPYGVVADAKGNLFIVDRSSTPACGVSMAMV